MQAIHGYPNFVSGVSSVAQISKLEELVKDHERCSGQTYPREILLSTVPIGVFQAVEATYPLAADRSDHVCTSEGKCTCL